MAPKKNEMTESEPIKIELLPSRWRQIAATDPSDNAFAAWHSCANELASALDYVPTPDPLEQQWCAGCEIALGYGKDDCEVCKAWRDALPKTVNETLLDDLREAVTLYAGDGVITDEAILAMAAEQARIAANCSCGRCAHPTALKSGRHVHCGVCGARMTEKAWLKLKVSSVVTATDVTRA